MPESTVELGRLPFGVGPPAALKLEILPPRSPDGFVRRAVPRAGVDGSSVVDPPPDATGASPRMVILFIASAKSYSFDRVRPTFLDGDCPMLPRRSSQVQATEEGGGKGRTEGGIRVRRCARWLTERIALGSFK